MIGGLAIVYIIKSQSSEVLKMFKALPWLLTVWSELIEVDYLFFVRLENGQDVAWAGTVEVLDLEEVENCFNEEWA